jgi:phosphopentomutase
LGIRRVFGDVGVTIADVFGVEVEGLAGTSFAREIGFGEHAGG